MFQAAPKMVRALRNLFGEARHLTHCPALRDPRRNCNPDCEEARDALVAVGALPS